LSEACATRVAVAAAFGEQARGRVGTYLHALRQRQRLRPADEVLAGAVDILAVRETERIAMQVRARLLA
ncbi:ELM1/GtrOC1 family putative glycosyltransferase, partial [Xanthomonas phaseoli]